MFQQPSKLPQDDKSIGENAKRMIIEEMESLLGCRDTAYTIDDDISYNPKGPMVWTYDKQNKKCKVLLSEGCLNSWSCFVYEMAHESVHLLNPQPESASYLEEGIAVWFSDHMMQKHGYSKHYPKGKYRKAVEHLALIPETPPNIVKKVRSKYLNLTNLSFSDLRDLYPTLTIKEATILTSIMK